MPGDAFLEFIASVGESGQPDTGDRAFTD